MCSLRIAALAVCPLAPLLQDDRIAVGERRAGELAPSGSAAAAGRVGSWGLC